MYIFGCGSGTGSSKRNDAAPCGKAPVAVPRRVKFVERFFSQEIRLALLFTFCSPFSIL
jgi:hypothetical protein